MEIAYILSQNRGALPQYAAQLANAVAEHADVTVLKPTKTTADELFSDDVTIIDAFEPMRLSQPDIVRLQLPVRENLRGLYSYRNLKKIERVDPDVIHDPTNMFPQVKLFAKRYGLDEKYPFVVTFHNVDTKLIVPSQPAVTAKNLLYALIPDLDLARIVVHAENQRDELTRLRPGTPIDVIPHGTFDHFTAYDYEERPEERNTILFFGNVVSEKGIDTLVEAIPLIRRRIPDITLLIAGDGRLSKQTKRIIDEYEANFEVHDYFIPNDRVGEFFSRAELVVLPYCERDGGEKGHSGVLATANAFGKPVVATTVADLPRLVEGSGAGTCVPPDNPQALADAIMSVLRDKPRRREMAAQSTSQGSALSWDRVAERHLAAYEAAVERRPLSAIDTV